MSNTIIIKKNGKFLGDPKGDFHDFNDPSDAWDYLIFHEGLPMELALKSEPDYGWSWKDLPFRFGWKGNLYELNILGDPSISFPLTSKPYQSTIINTS